MVRKGPNMRLCKAWKAASNFLPYNLSVVSQQQLTSYWLQVEWLKPYTDDAIRELGQNGTKSLLAVPISFVSEHIETLEEMDMEYRELALESGVKNWGRVPALNTNVTFINDLADLVIEKLPSAQPRPGYSTEALNLGPPTGEALRVTSAF